MIIKFKDTFNNNDRNLHILDILKNIGIYNYYVSFCTTIYNIPFSMKYQILKEWINTLIYLHIVKVWDLKK